SRRRHTRFSRDWSSDVCSSDLQEVTQERFLSTPQYEIVGASGPGHRREYTAEVTFGDGISGKGRGRTKRDAEQMAAREALAGLEIGRASCRERGESAGGAG